MSDEKTFYFKIEGRVYAKDEGEAQDYLYHLLENKCERFWIKEVDEVE